MAISSPVAPFARPVAGFRAKPYFRLRASSNAPTPDFFSSEWLESRKKRPFGPKLDFSAEEAIQCQLDALKYNDQPRQDYGIEVMYRFAGFNPFERSTYFGPFFDLGQVSKRKDTRCFNFPQEIAQATTSEH